MGRCCLTWLQNYEDAIAYRSWSGRGEGGGRCRKTDSGKRASRPPSALVQCVLVSVEVSVKAHDACLGAFLGQLEGIRANCPYISVHNLHSHICESRDFATMASTKLLFDFTGSIVRKKNVSKDFTKLAIQQQNEPRTTTIYIPRDESSIVYNPSDGVNFLYLGSCIWVTGYSFIKDGMHMHHVENCSLVKCAANVKVIKDILSLPNCTSYAVMLNFNTEEELSTLLKTETSQKAIVMSIMTRLSGVEKKVTWRPGRIKTKDLDILHRKEAEGNSNGSNSTSWELCQPCQPLNEQMAVDGMLSVNLPEGGSDLVSTHGKLTRKEYLDTKKNNQTQWFVERIRNFHNKDKQPLTFLDVGGGRGDLAVHIAINYPNAFLIVVDCNESSIAAGREYARKCNVQDRIEFVHQNFSDYYAEYSAKDGSNKVDIVVALHACGDLSDMALQFAKQNECDFVICPCCYPKRYLAPFQPFWHSLCNEDEVDSLSRLVELDNESRNDESRRAMLVINSMRRQAFEDKERCVKVEEFSNKWSKRNIVLVRDSVS